MSAQHKLKAKLKTTRPKPLAVRPPAKRAPGRPSKLTPKQWDEIRRRLAAGESTSALARAFGVSKASISGRCSIKVERLKTLANKKLTVDHEFENLPVSEQAAVINLVDQMQATTTNLATAARHGSGTSARLATIAHDKAVRLDPDAVNMDDLKKIAALTQTANQAASLGTALLAASLNAPPEEIAPPPSPAFDFSKWSTEDLEVVTALFGKYKHDLVQSSEHGSTSPTTSSAARAK